METKTLRETLGFSNQRFHFGSVMMLFTAFFISDWVFDVAFDAYTRYFVGGFSTTSPEFFIRTILSVIGWVSIFSVLATLALGVLLCLCFRLIENDLLAVLVAIVAFMPISAVIMLLNYIEHLRTAEKVEYLTIVFSIINFTLYYVSIIVCVSLAYLLFKNRLLALLLGAVVGCFLYFCFLHFTFLIRAIEIKIDLVVWRFVISMFSGLVFGLTWWFLLWLAEDKTPASVGKKPFMSKQNYIGFIAAGFFTTPMICLAIFNIISQFFRPRIPDYFLIPVGVGLVFLGIITFYTFIYRIWSSIQDAQYVRTGPSFAVVGFLIPFFNLYWIFQALPGFAADYNNYIYERRINVAPLSSGLLMTWCILTLASGIPLIGILCGVANIFVTLLMISKTLDAVNAAQDFKGDQTLILPNAGSWLPPNQFR